MINRQFSITSLTVREVPKDLVAERYQITNAYKKNLKAGTYYFNAWHKDSSPFEQEFFGM